MLATRTQHEDGVEPPQPGLRCPGRHRYSRRESIPKRTESGDRPFLRPCGVSAGRPDSLGKWSGIRVSRPVFRFGRPACFSQHLCPRKWELIVVVGFFKRRDNTSMTIPAELLQRLAAAKSVTVLTGAG